MVPILVLLLLQNYCYAADPSMGIQKTYYGYDFHRSIKLGAAYNYVVKVIVGKNIMGAGVHIHKEYVLTSRLYGQSKPKCSDIIVATWDSSKRHRRSIEQPNFLNYEKNPSMRNISTDLDMYKKNYNYGDYRQVKKIFTHPDCDKPCNYDLIILKVVAPFKKSISIGNEPKLTLEKPSEGDECLVVAAFPDSLLGQKVKIQDRRKVCSQHKRTKNYEQCRKKYNLICIQMDTPVYGAPLICKNKIVGIIPRDVDLENEVAVVQFIDSYVQWVADITKADLKYRKSVGYVLQKTDLKYRKSVGYVLQTTEILISYSIIFFLYGILRLRNYIAR